MSLYDILQKIKEEKTAEKTAEVDNNLDMEIDKIAEKRITDEIIKKANKDWEQWREEEYERLWEDFLRTAIADLGALPPKDLLPLFHSVLNTLPPLEGVVHTSVHLEELAKNHLAPESTLRVDENLSWCVVVHSRKNPRKIGIKEILQDQKDVLMEWMKDG